MITVRASRYAHLVELGFTQKMRGRTKRIPAKPFFRPALDETRSKIIGTVIDSLREALEKIMTKLAMKSAAGRVAA
jgi:histone H3/H4